MNEKPTADTIAAWMLAELERDDLLYQDVAAHWIAEQFGEEFTFINDNGNRAIAADILKSFAKLTGDGVVWERGARLWRKRRDYDAPGRQQP